jgi:hypothetical protein
VIRAIRWYYRRKSGTRLKELASEEAERIRRRRGAAARGTAEAVTQAERRIRAAIDWFESLFPAKTTSV